MWNLKRSEMRTEPIATCEDLERRCQFGPADTEGIRDCMSCGAWASRDWLRANGYTTGGDRLADEPEDLEEST